MRSERRVGEEVGGMCEERFGGKVADNERSQMKVIQYSLYLRGIQPRAQERFIITNKILIKPRNIKTAIAFGFIDPLTFVFNRYMFCRLIGNITYNCTVSIPVRIDTNLG